VYYYYYCCCCCCFIVFFSCTLIRSMYRDGSVKFSPVILSYIRYLVNNHKIWADRDTLMHLVLHSSDVAVNVNKHIWLYHQHGFVQLATGVFPVIHFWHAPLWVHCAKRRHNSPEWMILPRQLLHSGRGSMIPCRSCWVVFIHIVRGRPGGLLQFSR